MKVLYLGTPGCSAHCLDEIIDADIEVVGVVTQPDRPFGRNLSLRESPVKIVAVKHGLRHFQPEKASSPEVIEELSKLEPDITVVFAFGEFLSDAFLAIPKISTVNLHLSLLPKYRGAAPVRWAIVEGEKVTGATTFHIVKEMDAGDIIYQERVAISDDDTSEALTERLTEVGSKLMVRTVKDLYDGKAPRTPQDHSLATRARKLKKSDGLIDWSVSSERIHNLVRGMNPWPCAYSFCGVDKSRKMLKFFAVKPVEVKGDQPGKVFVDGDNVFVTTGDGAVKIVSVQPECKKKMSGPEFLNGHRNIVGTVLG